MRHFNIIILILMINFVLFAEESSLIVQFDSTDYIPHINDRLLTGESELIDFLDTLQHSYQKEGLLRTTFSCISLERKLDTTGTLVTIWKVSNQTPVYIDSVVAPGIKHILSGTMTHMFKPLISDIASEQSLVNAINLIDGYRSLTVNGRPYYATYQQEKVALVLPLSENFQNFFSGTAGYLPQQSRKSQVTGDIQIHLENPLGTASVADFLWQQKDRESQMFSITYEEPFIWKLNLGMKTRFYQNLQDGLYVMRKFNISAVKSYSVAGKWSLGGENSSVTATPEGDSLGIGHHTVRSLVVENEWERRDNIWNPGKGFYFRWNTEIGDFSQAGSPDAVLYRFRFRSEMFKPLKGRWLLMLGSRGGIVNISGKEAIPLSEQFRYGGASTLRGFQEQSFLSRWMLIGQLEFRYLLSQFNRIYFFTDSVLHLKRERLPIAGGIGIQQKIPVGILRLEYALNRDDSPSKGKIHIRLSGQF